LAESCYHCGEPITPELRWQCAEAADGRHEFPSGSVGWYDHPKVEDPTGPLALIIYPDGSAATVRLPADRGERWELIDTIVSFRSTIPHPLDDGPDPDWCAILSDPDPDAPGAADLVANPVAAEVGRQLGWYPGPVAGPVVVIGSTSRSPEGDADVPAQVVDLARQAGATGLTPA
jgi:hypothetical protein